jgi:hypothetical protein
MSGNFLPPRNPIARRILLSILIGIVVQSAVVTMVPGYLIIFLFFDDSLKAGADINDWRILLANMLLYGCFSLLLLTSWENSNRVKKSVKQ